MSDRGPRGAGWAAALSVLVAVLAAAATIVDKDESLRWLWVALIVAGALVGAPTAVLASPWWQHRQDDRARQMEVAARRMADQHDHFEPSPTFLASSRWWGEVPGQRP
jgi:hypothetical protein